VIDTNFKPADFFNHPADESKRAKQMTPGTVNKYAGGKDSDSENDSSKLQILWFVYLEGVNCRNYVERDNKCNQGKCDKK